MKPDPTPLSSAIEAVTSDLYSGTNPAVSTPGTRSPGGSPGDLANRWADVVGPPLDTCTLPGSFIDGVLTIHAHDPGAASLVRQSSGDLVTRLREAFGIEMTRIKVVVTRSR